MSLQNIINTPSDSGLGDSLKIAFDKVNFNFNYLLDNFSGYTELSYFNDEIIQLQSDINEIGNSLSGYSLVNHTHTINQITNLQNELNNLVKISAYTSDILVINNILITINDNINDIITILDTKLSDAPFSGITYGRKDGQWVQISGGTSDLSGYVPFTGGTVSGATNFTGGLTANTISATTYQNLPPISLDGLSDVTISTGVTTGNTLMFDGSFWQNVDPFDYFDAKPVIYQKHINLPVFASASANNVEGIPLVIGGGLTARNWADTNIVTRTQRAGLVSTTTGSPGQQIRQLNYGFSRNSGFKLLSGFNMAENAADTGIRFLLGVRNSIGTYSNTEPDTLINILGFCRLSTSNNLHIIHNDNTGTATTIDLGSNFPANTDSIDKYIFKIETVPTGVYFRIDRIETPYFYEVTVTTDIPGANLGFSFGGFIVDTAGANTNTGFDWYGTYIKI